MFGQLQNRYPNKLSEEIVGNCDTKIDTGTNDVLTAEYFCSLMGVSTVETTSIRKHNSLEGDIEDYGQKNISTLKRNLLNIDEILRLPSIKLIVNIRGNKPLLLDKMIYTEHPLAKKLKDSLITDYNPKWIRNNTQKIVKKEKDTQKTEKNKEKLSWDNF